MPLHVTSTCAYHQEVKIVLHSPWFHHTYRCDDTRDCVLFYNKFISCHYMFRAHVIIIRRSKLHYTASGIITPPDDEHMCSKHVEAWNKLIVKQKFCASSWLITQITILPMFLVHTRTCSPLMPVFHHVLQSRLQVNTFSFNRAELHYKFVFSISRTESIMQRFTRIIKHELLSWSVFPLSDPENSSCHRISRWMYTFYAVKLSCSVRR